VVGRRPPARGRVGRTLGRRREPFVEKQRLGQEMVQEFLGGDGLGQWHGQFVFRQREDHEVVLALAQHQPFDALGEPPAGAAGTAHVLLFAGLVAAENFRNHGSSPGVSVGAAIIAAGLPGAVAVACRGWPGRSVPVFRRSRPWPGRGPHRRDGP